MVSADSHEVGNKMKFVTVLITISTVVVGLHSLAEPDQHPMAAKEDIQREAKQPAEEERFGFGQAFASSSANRPLIRPPPSPIPLNMVECYACTDCPKVLADTPSKLCPYTLDPTKQNKCVVYAEQYKHMKKPWYIRGCSSERGSCADIRQAHSSHTDVVKLLNCYECEGDRCNTNSGSHSLIDITMAFFAMVVTPLIAKYTLA